TQIPKYWACGGLLTPSITNSGTWQGVKTPFIPVQAESSLRTGSPLSRGRTDSGEPADSKVDRSTLARAFVTIGGKKTPASLGEAGAISRPWFARLIADRDAPNAHAVRRTDQLLGDIAVGGNVGRRRDDSDAPTPVAMEVAVTVAVHM